VPFWPFFWFSKEMVTESAVNKVSQLLSLLMTRPWHHSCTSFFRSGTVLFFLRAEPGVYSPPRSKKKKAITTSEPVV
jgi:hypothetical protein